MKTIEECVKIYQETGVYIPEASVYENEYLLQNIQDIYEEYIEEFNKDSPEFAIHVLQRLADWQLDIGFGKDYYYTKENVDIMFSEDLDEEDM